MPEVNVFGIRLEVNIEQAEKFRVLKEQADATKTSLVDAFNQGSISAEDFNKQISDSDNDLRQYARAVQTASGITREHASAHGSLASQLGTSKAQLGAFVSTALEASGVDATLAQGIQTLTTNIGALGIALSLLTIAYQKALEADKAINDANRTTAQAMAARGASIDEIIASLEKQNEANDRAFGHMVVVEKKYRDIAEAAYNAAQGGGHYVQSTYDMASASAYATGVLRDEAEALEAIQVAARAAAGNLRDMEGGNLVTQADAVATAFTDLKVKQLQGQNEIADAKRRADDADARSAAMQAKRNAELIAQYNEMGEAVTKYAGEKGRAAFELIANSSLDAADKVSLLHRYISQLPEDVRSRIQLYIDTHGLDALMALFGVRGFAPGGHQQGNEWDFTFEGEDPATRKAFLDANNNDVEAARRAWYEQHQRDLEQRGKERPPDWQNPYNPANSGNQGMDFARAGWTGGASMPPIVVNYTANGFHTADEESLRATLLPVMERIIRELAGR